MTLASNLGHLALVWLSCFLFAAAVLAGLAWMSRRLG